MTDQHPSEPDSRPDVTEQDTADVPGPSHAEAGPEAEGEATHPDPPDQALRTGNAAVDEVLGSLADLDQAPLAEHPGAFERAHDALRAALTDARERPAETGSGAED